MAAYVANNAVRPSELPALIASVSAALQGLGAAAEPEPEVLRPTVSIKKSITPDYLISLEDGRHYKTLKRHLATRGLTPVQYHAKWGLPGSYPMVASSYSKHRSELARSLGLGQVRRSARAAPARATGAPAAATKPARGGRKRKAQP